MGDSGLEVEKKLCADDPSQAQKVIEKHEERDERMFGPLVSEEERNANIKKARQAEGREGNRVGRFRKFLKHGWEKVGEFTVAKRPK
jgi:hypothetical protein